MMPLKSLVPMVHVRSVTRSIEFYRRLGFDVGNTHAPEGVTEPVWAWIHSGGAHLMLAQAGEPVDPRAQAALFYLYCKDVETFRRDLLDAGLEAGPVERPFCAPRGQFRVTDPDGYALIVMHT